MNKILYIFLICTLIFPQRRISEESIIFSKCKNQVFKVFGKSGAGSGFLIDERGIILTNDHVLGDKHNNLSVQLNDTLKVEAIVIKRDSYKDLATIGVNPDIIKSLGLKSLTIATKNDTMIFNGERIIAIGYPLTQQQILTSGIISRFDENIIMHDANINPGNSGGPLINMNAEVIGINTFMESSSGPGIYGSVNIIKAYDIISKSKMLINNQKFESVKSFSSLENNYTWKCPRCKKTKKSKEQPECFDCKTILPPNKVYMNIATEFKEQHNFNDINLYTLSKNKLSVMPQSIFPLNALEKSINEDFPESVYHLVSADNFDLWFYTPPQMYALSKLKEKRLSSKRNSKVNESRYELYSDLKEWKGLKPVVRLIVDPKIGETQASACGNFFGAALTGIANTSPYNTTNSTYYSQRNYEFKSDVQDVKIFRNGKKITPIEIAYHYTTLDFKNISYYGSQSGEDMAQRATLTLPIEEFLPMHRNKFSTYMIVITDFNTGKVTNYQIPENTIYKINADFAPYTKNYEGKKLYKKPSGGCSS